MNVWLAFASGIVLGAAGGVIVFGALVRTTTADAFLTGYRRGWAASSNRLAAGRRGAVTVSTDEQVDQKDLN